MLRTIVATLRRALGAAWREIEAEVGYAASGGIPHGWDNKDHRGAKVTFGAIDEATTESLKDDLEELGLTFEPRRVYTAHDKRYYGALASHRRCDRQFDRANKAREQLLALGDQLRRHLRLFAAATRRLLVAVSPDASAEVRADYDGTLVLLARYAAETEELLKAAAVALERARDLSQEASV